MINAGKFNLLLLLVSVSLSYSAGSVSNAALLKQVTECKPWLVPREQQCSYVIEHAAICYPDGGIQAYLKYHFCDFRHLHWLSWIILILGMLIAFGFLLTAAERFFCPALEIISDYLHLSPAVAGATLLSFGNGAPDVFTQIAAVKAGDPAAVGMALSEPLGGGLFTSNVVLGAVVLLSNKSRKVSVHKHSFLKDLVFYIVALLLMMVILSDQQVVMSEALALASLYLVYVVATLYISQGDEPVHVDGGRHEVPPEERIGEIDSVSNISSATSSPRCRPEAFRSSGSRLTQPLLPADLTNHGSQQQQQGQQQGQRLLEPYGPIGQKPDQQQQQQGQVGGQQLFIGEPAEGQEIVLNQEPKQQQRGYLPPSNLPPLQPNQQQQQQDKEKQQQQEQQEQQQQHRSSPPQLLPQEGGADADAEQQSGRDGESHSSQNHLVTDACCSSSSGEVGETTSTTAGSSEGGTAAAAGGFALDDVGRTDHLPSTLAAAGGGGAGEGKATEDSSTSLIGMHHLPPLKLPIHSSIGAQEGPQGSTAAAAAAAGRFDQRQQAQQQQMMEEGFLGGNHLHHHHQQHQMGWHHRLQQPFLLSLALTMPRVGSVHPHHYTSWRAALLPFTVPLFLVAVNGLADDISWAGYLYGGGCSLVGSLIIAALYPGDGLPRGALKGVFAALAFVLSMVWLNVSAGAVVQLSSVVGKIMGINPAILGATILAWGNSGPDMVNNISMGRDGFPTMAITACFASPLFSLLVGMATALAYGVSNNHGVLHCVVDKPLVVMYGFAAANLVKFLIVVPLVYRFTLGKKMAITAFVFYLTYNVVYGMAQAGVF